MSLGRCGWVVLGAVVGADLSHVGWHRLPKATCVAKPAEVAYLPSMQPARHSLLIIVVDSCASSCDFVTPVAVGTATGVTQPTQRGSSLLFVGWHRLPKATCVAQPAEVAYLPSMQPASNSLSIIVVHSRASSCDFVTPVAVGTATGATQPTQRGSSLLFVGWHRLPKATCVAQPAEVAYLPSMQPARHSVLIIVVDSCASSCDFVTPVAVGTATGATQQASEDQLFGSNISDAMTATSPITGPAASGYLFEHSPPGDPSY